ncbi:MAG: EF-hand domain-containing protein [Myxococcota bacterium]|nr:EF-hand domain-containing protein [Myxococcota bacterium]
MHRMVAAAAPAAFALLLAAGATQPVRAQATGQAVVVADRNDDGIVDRREFEERMVDVFFILDVDKDGGLVAAEVPRVGPEAFARADRNGDGRLQLPEFLEARAADFERADRDDDGGLNATEAAAYDAAQ